MHSYEGQMFQVNSDENPLFFCLQDPNRLAVTKDDAQTGLNSLTHPNANDKKETLGQQESVRLFSLSSPVFICEKKVFALTSTDYFLIRSLEAQITV